jgi:hypothetical protein
MALILRVRKMPAQRAFGTNHVVSKKKTTCDREPDVAHHIGITGVSGKAPAFRDLNLSFRPINHGFVECDREADRRVQNLIVIREVVRISPVIVDINASLTKQGLASADLVVVSMRGLHW